MILDRHPETGRLVIHRPVPLRDVSRAFACLALLLRSGVGMVRSLRILEEQEAHPLFKRVLLSLRTSVSNGAPLSQTMDIHPLAFNTVQCALVGAGETSGRLPDMLDRLALGVDKDQRLLARLKAAAMYPVMVLSVSAVVLTLLSQTLLRTALPMLEASGQALPLATRMLLSATSPLGLLGLAIAVIVVGLSARMLTLAGSGRWWWAHTSLKLPLVGACLLKIELSRVLRSLASLYEAGIPILQGFEVVAGLTSNPVIRHRVEEVATLVRHGETLADALGRVSEFPVLVRQFAEIGETTGQLGAMLLRMSDYFDQEVEHAIDMLMAAIEPALIAVMGLLVGIIVIVAFAPMYQLMSRMSL